MKEAGFTEEDVVVLLPLTSPEPISSSENVSGTGSRWGCSGLRRLDGPDTRLPRWRALT
jgi:hypothetical protein